MLSNIRIVLVKTFHSGNIGSTARAMKTMGLSELCLVNPVDFATPKGQAEAQKMATSAVDVLDQAKQFEQLYEAVKDAKLVIASSARSRGYDLPELSPEACAKLLNEQAQHAPVALVLGPERAGLINQDLQYATHRVTIPTNPEYGSLNLAAAVQTLSYEIYKQHMLLKKNAESPVELPSREALEQLYQHLEKTLSTTGFIMKKHPGEIMQKLRTLFNKAELDDNELNILRGILASVDKGFQTPNASHNSHDNTTEKLTKGSQP